MFVEYCGLLPTKPRMRQQGRIFLLFQLLSTYFLRFIFFLLVWKNTWKCHEITVCIMFFVGNFGKVQRIDDIVCGYMGDKVFEKWD